MAETRGSGLRRTTAYSHFDKQVRARQRWARQIFKAVGRQDSGDESLSKTSKEAFMSSAAGVSRNLLNQEGVSMVIFDRDAAGQVYAVRYWQRDVRGGNDGDGNDDVDQARYHSDVYENGTLVDKEV